MNTPPTKLFNAWEYLLKSEDTRPVLILISVFIIIIILILGLKMQVDTVDQEMINLIKYGRLVHAEIVDFKPYSYVVRGGKSGRGREHHGIDVRIKCETLDDKVIYEDWNYDLKGGYKVGDFIDVYVWEKNFWIKAASANRRSVANKSQVEAEFLRNRMGPSES